MTIKGLSTTTLFKHLFKVFHQEEDT